MRICFPVASKDGLQDKVFGHFGSAPLFHIYDTDTQQSLYVDNGNNHQSHGGCAPTGVITQHNVNAVMTNGMGQRAVQKLNACGVKVYLLDNDTVESAIQKFNSNTLKELTSQDACSGHH